MSSHRYEYTYMYSKYGIYLPTPAFLQQRGARPHPPTHPTPRQQYVALSPSGGKGTQGREMIYYRYYKGYILHLPVGRKSGHTISTCEICIVLLSHLLRSGLIGWCGVSPARVAHDARRRPKPSLRGAYLKFIYRARVRKHWMKGQRTVRYGLLLIFVDRRLRMYSSDYRRSM